jgi:ribonuclease BN (tRNA processing enzyme)
MAFHLHVADLRLGCSTRRPVLPTEPVRDACPPTRACSSRILPANKCLSNCSSRDLDGTYESTNLLPSPVSQVEKCFEMRAVIIGSGASWPDSDRSSPSQVIVVGNEPLLFDCGPGTGMNLMKVGINPTTISRVFLTHLHMDHSLEFPSIVFGSYLLGRKDKVYLYGPPGTVDFCRLLFEKIYPYAPEIIRRIRTGGLEVTPYEATEGRVLQTENYRVLSAPVKHGIRGIAYRIETKEGTVVISGDTRFSRSLIDLAKGADLLLHECSFPDDMVEFARETNHSVPSEVGEVAEQAGVKKLVLTHLFPPCKGREKEMVKSASSKFRGEVIASHDLLEIGVRSSRARFA